jgi:hypothetical protein
MVRLSWNWIASPAVVEKGFLGRDTVVIVP